MKNPAAHRVAGDANGATAAQPTAGLRERRAHQRGPPGEPAGGLARHRVLLQQHQRHVPPRRRASHGHAGVAAQADDRRHVLLAEEAARRQIAGQVFHEEGHRFPRMTGQRMGRQGHIVEAGMAHCSPLEGFSRPAERDPHLRNGCGKPLGDGQAGKQMPPGAAAGKDDVDRVSHHGREPLSLRERDTSRADKGDSCGCSGAWASANVAIPILPSAFPRPPSPPSFSDAVPSKAHRGRRRSKSGRRSCSPANRETENGDAAVHSGESPPPPLVLADLKDHAGRLGNEHAADDHQQQFLPGDDGQHSQQAAQGQRPRVAHEHLGRMAIEPEEAQHVRRSWPPARDGHFAGTGNPWHAQVLPPTRHARPHTPGRSWRTVAASRQPPAKPSRPSVRFTAFEAPTITSKARGMNHNPSETAIPVPGTRSSRPSATAACCW